MKQSFSYQTKVEFADTDSAGVAHFTSIMKMVEKAEHAYLEHLGIPILTRSAGRAGAPEFGWPRVDVRFRFRLPLVFGDTVTVNISLHEIGGRSISYFARVIGEDGEVAAEGKLVNACVGPSVDGKMRAVEIPDAIRAVLNEQLAEKSDA